VSPRSIRHELFLYQVCHAIPLCVDDNSLGTPLALVQDYCVRWRLTRQCRFCVCSWRCLACTWSCGSVRCPCVGVFKVFVSLFFHFCSRSLPYPLVTPFSISVVLCDLDACCLSTSTCVSRMTSTSPCSPYFVRPFYLLFSSIRVYSVCRRT
jgi:hypothetical protein